MKFALTLTLSRRPGEGTAVVCFKENWKLIAQQPVVALPGDGERFSLSHWMGEGRGEGSSTLNLL